MSFRPLVASQSPEAVARDENRGDWSTAGPLLAAAILVLGFLLRLRLAGSSYLNADEALIYFISAQGSLAATYKAGLISAHPPLFYLVLHYWRLLGNSELMLRLPSVLAGTGFCWLGFKWLGRVADEATALCGLIFFCFTPTLVSLGAEVRQYSLLLLFVAAGLYFLERGLQENSALFMALFSLTLWLAILTQYSAWLFCPAVGIYALSRLGQRRSLTPLAAVWASGQFMALGVFGFLWKTQLWWLVKVAQVDRIFAGERNQLRQLPRETFRLFHYLFSQPVAGAVVLLLFTVGTIRLFQRRRQNTGAQPSSSQLAWLLLMPFIFSAGAAAAHLYPFDGTRHSIVLATFVIAGASLGLTGFGRPRAWSKPGFAVVLLIGGYAFSAPLGPYIKPSNQSRQWAVRAVNYLRQAAPPGSVFLVDDQSSYLFRYYFCRDQAMTFSEVPAQFQSYTCGQYRLAGTSQWMLSADSVRADLLRTARIYGLNSGETVWLFQAGWNVNKEPALQAKLRDWGCREPHHFGENMLACRLKL